MNQHLFTILILIEAKQVATTEIKQLTYHVQKSADFILEFLQTNFLKPL